MKCWQVEPEWGHQSNKPYCPHYIGFFIIHVVVGIESCMITCSSGFSAGKREKSRRSFQISPPLTPKEFEIIVFQWLLPLGPREPFPVTGVHSPL